MCLCDITERASFQLYQGVLKDGYKHPRYLAEMDIVITTYDVLEKELCMVNFKQRGKFPFH